MATSSPKRRRFSFSMLRLLIACLIALPTFLLVGCNNDPTPAPGGGKWEVQRTEAEWREQLTEEQYHVTREKGTERPFTGEYWDNKKTGQYHCIGCDLPLYDSDTKFKSGTGWPSFWKATKPDAVVEIEDRSHFMVRVELVCRRCGSHLGHVFPDGPPPTGMRHCINSASLKFVPKEADKADRAEDKSGKGSGDSELPAK